VGYGDSPVTEKPGQNEQYRSKERDIYDGQIDAVDEHDVRQKWSYYQIHENCGRDGQHDQRETEVPRSCAGELECVGHSDSLCDNCVEPNEYQ
jgi:hypothetical protein